MMTKKNTFFGALGILVLSYLSGWCGLRESCLFFGLGNFFDHILLSVIKPIFIVSATLFSITSLLLFMREEVFSAWFLFAKWLVPLTIILSILAGFGEQPSYMPAMITPGTVSFLMSSLFLIISLILIAYKFFTLKKGGAGK
jgi:hypothetical protein